MTVQLTLKQREAAKLLGGDASNIMLYGGSGSGKTFVICCRMIHTALSCPGSRQIILRKHLNHVRASIGNETMPDVLKAENVQYSYNGADNYFSFANGSIIALLGLDDKERAEKVLGRGTFTIYFNECSEMEWEPVQKAMTRNRQKIEKDMFGKPRRNRLYFDCNPPSKRHWCYKAFVEKTNPVSNVLWNDTSRWDYLQMNPHDNADNVGEEYIYGVLGEFSGKMRQRFLLGEWTDDTENALWKRDMIDSFRKQTELESFDRIVVAIDPSGGSGPGNCEAGIIVTGKAKIDNDDHYYVLEDLTVKGSPDVWAASAVNAYKRWQADSIVAETNYGGAMVESVIKAAPDGKNCGYRAVTATRGKIVRAEPIATLYTRGLVHHIGEFPLLEDELCSYIGTTGEKSPNRLDALVWGITDLMSGSLSTITKVSNHFGMF